MPNSGQPAPLWRGQVPWRIHPGPGTFRRSEDHRGSCLLIPDPFPAAAAIAAVRIGSYAPYRQELLRP